MEFYNMEYQDRLVAFIDVMGFKQILSDNVKPGTKEVSQKLKDYYIEASSFLEKQVPLYKTSYPDDDFQKIFVSDSIILSIKLNGDTVQDIGRTRTFLNIVGRLQYNLAINARIWTRGAISAGPLYIDEAKNILVGPAFVRVYEIEKEADYPRVIIDPMLLARFQMQPHEFTKTINKEPEECRIMDYTSAGSLSIGNWKGDAIQLDWFFNIYWTDNSMEEFFKDLRARQGIDLALFRKSVKLLGYLQQVHFECTTMYQTDLHTEVQFDDRVRAVGNELAQTTGVPHYGNKFSSD